MSTIWSFLLLTSIYAFFSVYSCVYTENKFSRQSSSGPVAPMLLWSKCLILLKHYTHTHTHTRLTTLFPGLPGWAGTRKVKPIWILLKQETVSGNGISWAICKSAPHSRQITMPAPHCSDFFYRPDALPAAQPTASKHWRQVLKHYVSIKCHRPFNC